MIVCYNLEEVNVFISTIEHYISFTLVEYKRRQKMSIWYKSSEEINCQLDTVKQEVKSMGQLLVGVVKLMPGLTSVELIEATEDTVIIKTNEGLMNRSNILISLDKNLVTIDFNESYQAGKMSEFLTHYKHIFEMKDDGVLHTCEISNVKASGFMGFLYKNFAKKSIGSATMNAYKKYLESL